MYKLKKQLSEKTAELEENRAEIEKLTQLSQEAIEKDEFDKAGEIEELINSKSQAQELLKDSILELNQEIISVRERELMYHSMASKAYTEVKDSFTKLKETMQKEYEEFKLKDASRHKNDQFKLKKMKEKLENLSQNLEIDKENLRLEEEKIDSLIKSQSVEVFNELENLNKKKTQTLLEIEELKRLLEEKYSYVDSLNIDIEAKENEIDAIKSNFKPEFKKLNTKRVNVEESQKDYDEQIKELVLMENNFNSNESYSEEKLIKYSKKIEEYSVEIFKFTNLTETVNINIVKMKENFTKENELKSKLHLLEMSYQQSIQTIENTKNEVVLLDLNNKKLESEIIGLDLKLPGLEEEKAKYVTSKNFKEAGRVSSELKKIAESKVGLNSKIEANNTLIKKLLISKEENKESLSEITNQIENCKLKLKAANYEGLLMLKNCYSELIESTKTSDFILLNNQEEYLFSINKGLEQIEREINTLEFDSYIQELYIKNKEEEKILKEEIKNQHNLNVVDVKNEKNENLEKLNDDNNTETEKEENINECISQNLVQEEISNKGNFI
jgi:hypothetical protein